MTEILFASGHCCSREVNERVRSDCGNGGNGLRVVDACRPVRMIRI